MKNRRIVIDIIVIAILLMVSIAGCMNSAQTAVETTASFSESSVSDASETEATTTTEKETTATTTVDLFEPDPTYEEAAAHVRDLFAEGNSVDQVIAILMEEGRTEFDATALVNSVLIENEGSNNGSGNYSSDANSGSNSSGNSSSGSTGETAATTATGSNSGQTTSPTTGGSASQTQETTAPTSQTKSTGTVETVAATPTATQTPTPTSTPVPTKVKQTVYMRIVWADQDIEAMAAQGIDLNAERPEAVGIDIYACDENGNYNAGSIIDRSDADAARDQMYAEADAILAKYGLTQGDYSYTVYKYENEYLYD